MKKRFYAVALGVIAVLVVATAILIGRWTVGVVNAESESYQDLKLFTEVISIVKNNYVEDVKMKDMIYGAIKGMVSSLDPHSGFMSPDVYKEMKLDTKGEFGGLGIQIGKKKGLLTVIAPIEDTPAYKAGIKAGDVIVKVDGELTDKMSLFDAVNKMRGKKGSKVVITIMREGWKEPKDFTIVRDIVKVKSVKYKMLEGGIGYIKLSQFQEKTIDELDKALTELKKEKFVKLILDLRNDPGGLLQSAVEVADEFLPANTLVVYIKDRGGDKKEFFTTGKNKLGDIPMVVLVNEGSASASEIVAGALKDWDRAVVVGDTTFGKGSVQSVLPLSDGSGLRLTTARYYTPKGTSIQNTGITPDEVVKLKPAENGKNHPIIREKDLKGSLDNEKKGGLGSEESEEQEMVPVEINDKDDTQLQRAIEILKNWEARKKVEKKAA